MMSKQWQYIFQAVLHPYVLSIEVPEVWDDISWKLLGLRLLCIHVEYAASYFLIIKYNKVPIDFLKKEM